jgi:hypothetical protein
VSTGTYITDAHFIHCMETMNTMRDELRQRQAALHGLRDLLVRDRDALNRAIWAEDEGLRVESQSHQSAE